MSKYSKRPRLKGFTYTGCHRYFITICTHQKYQAFCDKAVVAICLESLEEKSRVLNFKVWAYCFMPDHLHLLLEGKTKEEDLLDVVRYILNNPVRKGLVRHYTEYLYSGSLVLKDGIEGVL